MEQDDNNFIPPNQLRNFRVDEGLTQSEVAFLLDIRNAGRISEWENGLSNPGLEHLLALGLIYHRLPDEMYYELRRHLLGKLAARRKLLEGRKEKQRVRRESG